VDGLTDGLIEDPRQCAFDPFTDLPVCREGETVRPECYTQEEIRALATVYEDVVVDGEQLAPSFPVGSEAFLNPSGVGDSFLPGWYLWRVGTEKPLFEAFTETFLRYMAFQRPDPDFDMFSFDFEEDPARMEWLRPILDATDPDLHRFKDRGGKMLMYFGWADPAANPLMGTEYYERVLQEMGPSVPDFFKLFMVPGMSHGDFGVGVDSIPWLPTLMNWVEHGEAPNRIIGTRVGRMAREGEDAIGRTRPLCPYPQVARYKDEGEIDEESNFECVHPAGSNVSELDSTAEGREAGYPR
jgi:feruloyl esterase